MGQVPKEKPNAAGAAPAPAKNENEKKDAKGGKANDFAAAKNAAMFSGKRNPAG